MKNKILESAANYMKDVLMSQYGFCGIASSDNFTVLNTTDKEGNTIKISFEVKKD